MKPLRYIALALVVALCGFSLYRLVMAGQITTTHTASLLEVRKVGELEVLKTTLKDVVSIRQTHWGLIDTEVHLAAVGVAVYTVDLTQVSAHDIARSGGVIHIRIPEPVMAGVRLDHTQSRVISTSFITLSGAGLVDSAYRRAQGHLTALAASDTGAKAAAKAQAVGMVQAVLQRITGAQVQVHTTRQAMPVFELEPATVGAQGSPWLWVVGSLLIGGLLVSGGLIAWEITAKKQTNP